MSQTASGKTSEELLELGVCGSLNIKLDNENLRAGDAVTGTLCVTIRNTIQCEPLELVLVGEEIAQWTVGDNHHSRYQEFLHQPVLVTALPSPCITGEYLYPFHVILPSDIPVGVDVVSSPVPNTRIHLTIKYTLQAKIRVKTDHSSDIYQTMELTIQPKLPHAIANKHPRSAVTQSDPMEQTISKVIRLFRCFSAGTCHFAATIRKSRFTLGDTIMVDCVIGNESTVNVKHVHVRLYQDVAVYSSVPHASNDLSSSVCVDHQYAFGPKAGDTFEDPLEVAIVEDAENPSTRGNFVSCSYRLEVECEMNYGESMKIEFPVTVLAPPK